MTYLQNFFIYCGLYGIICGIWRFYEIIHDGKIKSSNKDTVIAIILAFAFWIIFHI